MSKIAIIFVISIITGCSFFTEQPDNTWDSPFQQLWSTDEYQWVGTTQVSSPLPLGDSLVFMSIGGDVVMLEQETGKIRWKSHVDNNTNIQSEIFVTDEINLYATHVQDVRAWDFSTGETSWIHDFPDDRGAFESEIVVRENQLIVGGFHHAYSLSTDNGSLLWSKHLGDSTFVADISLHEQKLYIGTGGYKDRGVFVLDFTNGDSLYNYIINDGIGHIQHAPIITDDIMYVGTSWEPPFSLESWDINTHELLWHYETMEEAYICDHCILVDDLLICSLSPFAIGAWNINTGKREWLNRPTQNYNWSRIGYDGRYIYYSHGWKLHVIEPSTGEILHSTYGPNGEYVYSIAVTDKRIFINGWPRNMCWTVYDPEKDED